MLKIKDNVDLKELEKFGFICGISGWSWKDNKLMIELYIDDCRVIAIASGNAYSFWCDIPNVVYDLISAGLVEKVVD